MDSKIVALIDKLQELKGDEAAVEELSYYAKLLHAELLSVKCKRDKIQSSKKISVIMPFYKPGEEAEEIRAAVRSKENKVVQAENIQREKQVVQEKEEVREEVNKPKQLPVEAEALVSASAGGTGLQTSLWSPEEENKEPKEEKETFPKELNELMAERRTSLNDYLKLDREEVGSRLGKGPVKDLHQAIGLNEKFGFINDLFRGDQSLYNRSIKTINESKDLNEALYWIDRELKIKLGWQEKDETVRRFYALIKKRFS